MNKYKNQTGFSALFLILYLVLAGILVGSGLYVNKAKNNANKSLGSASTVSSEQLIAKKSKDNIAKATQIPQSTPTSTPTTPPPATVTTPKKTTPTPKPTISALSMGTETSTYDNSDYSFTFSVPVTANAAGSVTVTWKSNFYSGGTQTLCTHTLNITSSGTLSDSCKYIPTDWNAQQVSSTATFGGVSATSNSIAVGGR